MNTCIHDTRPPRVVPDSTRDRVAELAKLTGLTSFESDFVHKLNAPEKRISKRELAVVDHIWNKHKGVA